MLCSPVNNYVSKERSASVFRVKESGRLESLSSPQWEPQMSHYKLHVCMCTVSWSLIWLIVGAHLLCQSAPLCRGIQLINSLSRYEYISYFCFSLKASNLTSQCCHQLELQPPANYLGHLQDQCWPYVLKFLYFWQSWASRKIYMASQTCPYYISRHMVHYVALVV